MTLPSSAISWTEKHWPIAEGCTPVSPGCLNCWAATFDGTRLAKNPRFRGLTVIRDGRHMFNGIVRFQPEQLAEPLKQRDPALVFPASRSDLFHEALADEQIAATFGVMAATPRLIYQALTKRPALARNWFRWIGFNAAPAITCMQHAQYQLPVDKNTRRLREDTADWPLPNVWLGTSVEDRKHGLPRIDELRKCPAAVRWLSIEPLLEDLGTINLDGIHWVVVGGESGNDARPCHLEWIRSVIAQCKAAGVACFVKQAGSHAIARGATTQGSPAGRLRLTGHGGHLDELPEDLRVRQWPAGAPAWLTEGKR